MNHYTYSFWRTHPNLIPDLFNWWRSTFGRVMGLGSIPGFGSNMSFQNALSNTRTDGIGALYREGTASLLNSMVNPNFPFATNDVVDSFVASLVSDQAAAAQAHLFKLANEGQLQPRV
ncbi:putative protodermal factor 1 [Helianthus anomalus]